MIKITLIITILKINVGAQNLLLQPESTGEQTNFITERANRYHLVGLNIYENLLHAVVNIGPMNGIVGFDLEIDLIEFHCFIP